MAAFGQEQSPVASNQSPGEQSPETHKHKVKVPPKYDINHIGERGIGGGVNFYSLEKEEMLGRELSGQVEQSVRLLGDPIITEYINGLGQKLVRSSDAKVPFTIKVIDDDEVNAFALPGGYFYVNTGLILAARTEAELAGVMAHEIAHVAARHATHNQTRAEIWNLATIPLIFAGGPAGYAVREAAGIVAPMSFLRFTRNAEREADLLGMEYEYAAGYDPQALVEFFERLKLEDKKRPSFVARAFTTHPMTADRIKSAQKAIEDYLPAREEYVVTTSEFEEMKTRLERLENRHLIDLGSSRPTLRQRQTTPGDKTGSAGDPGGGKPPDDQKDDGPPVLKRNN